MNAHQGNISKPGQFLIFSNACEICGKPRQTGNHRRCSQIKKQQSDALRRAGVKSFGSV